MTTEDNPLEGRVNQNRDVILFEKSEECRRFFRVREIGLSLGKRQTTQCILEGIPREVWEKNVWWSHQNPQDLGGKFCT